MREFARSGSRSEVLHGGTHIWLHYAFFPTSLSGRRQGVEVEKEGLYATTFDFTHFRRTCDVDFGRLTCAGARRRE